MYYGAYTCLTNLILVLRSLFLYFRSYTCITELILFLRKLYLCYRAYSCISDLIRILRNLYLSYETYTCVTELIRVFRILYVYYGTYICLTKLILVLHSMFLYFGSYTELILIEKYHTDAYQIRTLVHSRYRSQQIHIPDSYRFRTYPKTNKFIGLYHNHIRTYAYSDLPSELPSLFLFRSTRRYYTDSLYGCTRRYYWTYTYITELILILPIRKHS